MAEPLDLSSRRHVHIVGIGGAGLSAMAEVLISMGHRVSGSDQAASEVLERLEGLGATVHNGHGAGNLAADVDALVVSTAVPTDNAEVTAAGQRGVPVLRRADLLAAIAATKRTIAVAGTHGKTTTSAMLAHALDGAGWGPSFIVGGRLRSLGTGARWESDTEWLVLEADESDRTFLDLAPEAAIVTSVEPDHLEHHGVFADLVAAFRQFLASVTGPTVVAADDPTVATLGREAGAALYGFGGTGGPEFVLTDLAATPSGSRFRLQRRGQDLGWVEVGMPGRHNAANAAAATAMAVVLGAPFDAVATSIAGFQGVSRRFEYRGERDGVTFIDDYAHHPGEVAPTLDAARQGDWRRVVCVFQPHRFTRTEALWREFGSAFHDVDLLVVTDIYPAGETPRPGVSGKLIVDAVLEHSPHRRVAWFPKRSDLVEYLRTQLRPGDLCLSLGAGDLTTLPSALLGERQTA